MTALIKLTLGTGLWGSSTAELTLNHVRPVALKSPCNTTIIKVDNTHINVLAKGRTKEVEALAKNLKNCLIAIDSVEVES